MSRRDRISDFTRSSDRRRRFVARPTVSRQPSVLAHEAPKINSQVNKSSIKRTLPHSPPAHPKQNKSAVLQRQGLKKLPPFTPVKTKKKIPFVQIGAAMMAILIVFTVPYLFYKTVASSGGVVKSIKKEFIAGDDLPKYLISSRMMDVAAKVDPVSDFLNDSNDLTDPNHVGWYNKSSKPGQPGTSLYVGYVSGRNNDGAFHQIKRMREGDYIQVETGDGQVILYKVKKIEKYIPHQYDRDLLLKSAEDGKEGLNIITFTDRNDAGSDLGQYRYAVFAVRE